MSDPSGLPTTLTTSYPTTSAGSVNYMMMYPGRPQIANIPMQPSVGMQYTMPIGAAGTPIMPTIMSIPPMMSATPGMVAPTQIQQTFRTQRPRKPNSSSKQQMISKPPTTTSSPVTIVANPVSSITIPDAPKGPPVTVFVGNITEKAPDLMIRQILSTCGQIVSWKRVSGKAAFGFCEFGNPDAALRAIRLLHDMELGPRKLVLKVDAKAQNLLDEYKNEKRKSKHSDGMISEENSNDVTFEDDYIDRDMKLIDDNSRKRINDILNDYREQMQKYNPPNADDDKPKTGAEVTEARVQQTHQRLMQLTKSSATSNHAHMKIDLDTVDYAEDGKRDLISREIGKFREIMKKQEEEKEIERKKREEREKERERYRSPRSPSTNGRGRSQSYQSISSTRSISPESRSTSRHRSRLRSRSRERERERDTRKPRERSREREQRERERERERDRERDREREGRERDRERERERERGGDRGGDRDRDRERDRDRDREHNRLEAERERDRDRDRDRDHERSPRERDDRSDRDLLREKEEEEEAKQQKKRERIARDREAAYQERLREWETREKRKAKEASREKDKRRIKEEERQKEAKRLKEFLEDYDDERDDIKYYKGRELQERLADREAEVEMDNRDRQKEKEELEELKAKIYAGESNNPEVEFAKLLKAREELYKPKLLINVTEEQKKEKEREKEIEREKKAREKEDWDREQKRVEEQPPIDDGGDRLKTSQNSSRNDHEYDESRNSRNEDKHINDSEDRSKGGYNRSLSNSPAPLPNGSSRSPSPANSSYGTPPIPVPPPQSSQSSSTGERIDEAGDASDKDKKKRKKLDVKDVFNTDDDDAASSSKKRKLVPLDFSDDKKSKENKAETPKSQEEKRKHIKILIDKIPTDKSSLFKYALDWTSVDNTLMEKRIRPWINKKIIEYIGEPEPTLVDFICSKVLAGSDPQSILDDVQMVLDEEAEVFVVKMWRLLIYEVEAKKLGILK